MYIIGSCGFDSIPADMGILYTQDHFKGGLRMYYYSNQLKLLFTFFFYNNVLLVLLYMYIINILII